MPPDDATVELYRLLGDHHSDAGQPETSAEVDELIADAVTAAEPRVVAFAVAAVMRHSITEAQPKTIDALATAIARYCRSRRRTTYDHAVQIRDARNDAAGLAMRLHGPDATSRALAAWTREAQRSWRGGRVGFEESRWRQLLVEAGETSFIQYGAPSPELLEGCAARSVTRAVWNSTALLDQKWGEATVAGALHHAELWDGTFGELCAAAKPIFDHSVDAGPLWDLLGGNRSVSLSEEIELLTALDDDAFAIAATLALDGIHDDEDDDSDPWERLSTIVEAAAAAAR